MAGVGGEIGVGGEGGDDEEDDGDDGLEFHSSALLIVFGTIVARGMGGLLWLMGKNSDIHG